MKKLPAENFSSFLLQRYVSPVHQKRTATLFIKKIILCSLRSCGIFLINSFSAARVRHKWSIRKKEKKYYVAIRNRCRQDLPGKEMLSEKVDITNSSYGSNGKKDSKFNTLFIFIKVAIHICSIIPTIRIYKVEAII